MTYIHPTPIFKITVDGQDITAKINNRLIKLTLEDKRGLETDSLMIELSDHDGLLAIPPLNATIKLWLGWKHTGLVYKGSFIATEISHSGSPDILAIRATSADLKKTLKQKKERSFKNINIDKLIAQIATEYELNYIVHEQYQQQNIPHIDQNESDANLLTRIADEHDAIISVKNGTILMMPNGEGKTVSGIELPMFIITRNMGDSHHYSLSNDGNEITAVKAYYYDPKQAKRIEVLAGDETNQNIKELRYLYRDKETAELVAKTKLKQLKRNAYSLTYQLAYGIADLIPETIFSFEGLKAEIEDIYWLATHVTHTLNGSSGYTTQLNLELLLPDADDIAVLYDSEFDRENEAKYTGVTTFYQQGDKAIPLTKGKADKTKVISKLHKTKAEAQRRLDQEFALLNPETGKFEGRVAQEIKLYTGVKVYYKEKKEKTQHELIKGDQSIPKVIAHVYTSKKSAQKALDKAYANLQKSQAKKQINHKAQEDMRNQVYRNSTKNK